VSATRKVFSMVIPRNHRDGNWRVSDGALLVTMSETVVLVTWVPQKATRSRLLPVTVNYQEKT